MTTVMTSGCYDLLHVGHIRHLQECRKLGDLLIVALNSDASVRRRKGPHRPIVCEAERREMLLALDCVDLVLLFNGDTPIQFIFHLRPDIFAVGSDYTVEQVAGRELIESYGGRIVHTDCRVTSTTERIRLCREREAIS